MLHGIREGVLAVDAKGADQRAQRRGAAAARHWRRPGWASASRTSCPTGGCAGSSPARSAGSDLVAVTDEHLLVLNRMPVVVAGRNAGWVVTIRDRTELEALLRQLDSVEGLTTALRAQEHEFSNRLHVLSVLLELGEVEEATRYSQPAPERDDPGQRGDPGPGRLAGRRGPAAGQDHGRRGARRRRAPRPGQPARGRARREDLPDRDGARQPHRQRRRRRGRRPPHASATTRVGWSRSR